MSSEHWQQVKEALSVSKSLSGVALRNYLKHLKRTSPKVAKEVKELLAASSAAADDDFLGKPATATEGQRLEDSDRK